MQLLQGERISEVSALPSEALVETMRPGARDIGSERHLVASMMTRQFGRRFHHALPDSRRSSFRIDDHILNHCERFQRVPEMRDDNQVASADDAALTLSDQDRMIAAARDFVEGELELRWRNSQAQVSV